MRTFKPGLWSLILITVAILCITSAFTHRWWPDKSEGIGHQSAQPESASTVALVAPVKSTEAWANPGAWNFFSSTRADFMATYSEERAAENIAAGSPGNGIDGTIIFSQSAVGWSNYLGVPANRWRDIGLIEVEFTMRDGMKVSSRYFIHKVKNGPRDDMAVVEPGPAFRDFKKMFFDSTDITVTHIVTGEPIVQHFHNHIGG